jgi:hypothetical protein
MQDTSRDDMRRLLKSFGIQADEAVIAFLARNPQARPLRLRLALHDLTDYGSSAPAERLTVEIEGEIRP